ncbi:hypothetical protein OPV22_015514 [Ensete ventricosum]|uniref:Protein kinase domain-containing protein n=1 Tax=Ensete ventricosum TaxID=4639 RepID=A0AAV8PM82_ENSVE|nr:hypothetical protein OPV22_015514 [Ensete ventricosum]
MAIDAWRRGRIVGRGASATVSVAASLSSGEIFAVKSAELSSSGDLQREQRILSSLDSPYIVSYFGFEVGLCYHLFMEYAPEGSMSDEIKKRGGRLDELSIRSYTCDLLRGLAYLHSNGVVHCDLKSQNVLICSGGRAKIADLGCARRADEDGGGRVQPRGTPMFMAPEVARGEEQSASADVWALGCTVIEMATGQPPWPHASDSVSALHRIAFSTAVPEFPCWVSEDGKDFLSRCLRRDPRERWSAEQLLRHPFLASWTSSPLDDGWVSPKSTLDQGFWSAPSEEEEEEEEDDEWLEQPAEEDASERMQSLLGIAPNWTWGEDWVTVRSDGGDRRVDEVTRGSEAFTDVSATSNSEEFVDSTNHTEGSSDRATIKANCNFNDTNHVKITEGIKDRLALICECVRMGLPSNGPTVKIRYLA